MIEGAIIEPLQGSESERIVTQGGALRAYPGLCHRTPLGFRKGGIAETDRLHNKRLHTDATALSINSLAVASRLRWTSEVDQGGAGEPRSDMRLEGKGTGKERKMTQDPKTKEPGNGGQSSR